MARELHDRYYKTKKVKNEKRVRPNPKEDNKQIKIPTKVKRIEIRLLWGLIKINAIPIYN